jgi:hypothetical protein
MSTTVLAQVCPAGNPRVAPDSRYSITAPVAGQQVVTDLTTGLMWKRCSEGQTGAACAGTATTHNWTQALTLANLATHAGFSDWRLPNADELYSLVESGCYGPAINTLVFPATVAEGYWSSTTVAAQPASAWKVVFNGAFFESNEKGGNLHVRLLRSGPGRSTFDSGAELLLRDGFE